MYVYVVTDENIKACVCGSYGSLKCYLMTFKQYRHYTWIGCGVFVDPNDAIKYMTRKKYK